MWTSREHIKTLVGHSSDVNSVVFSANGECLEIRLSVCGSFSIKDCTKITELLILRILIFVS